MNLGFQDILDLIYEIHTDPKHRRAIDGYRDKITNRMITTQAGGEPPFGSPINVEAVFKPSETVGTAMDLMGRHRFYHIPLVNDRQELVGVLSVRSLIRLLAEFYPDEVYNLPPDPNQIMPTPEGG